MKYFKPFYQAGESRLKTVRECVSRSGRCTVRFEWRFP